MSCLRRRRSTLLARSTRNAGEARANESERCSFAGRRRLLLLLSLCLAGPRRPGPVTDTLTVRVGYYGMEHGPLCGGRAPTTGAELYRTHLPTALRAPIPSSAARTDGDLQHGHRLGAMASTISGPSGLRRAFTCGDISVDRSSTRRDQERRLFHLVHLCRPVRARSDTIINDLSVAHRARSMTKTVR